MRHIMITAAVILAFGLQVHAEETAPFVFKEATPKQDWEWDADDRFDELMEQLAINEASLDAVQAAISKKTRGKRSKESEGSRMDRNNRMMDRKGGGPMKWDMFYGTNAEKFFYHPIDPNTTYHTDTYLRQIGKYEDDKQASDIPTRQSLPVHQRPPQWDYIYKANRTASEQATSDASLLGDEIAGLEQRRTVLEDEQAKLWCKLAFRAVQRLNVARKPLLRFGLVPAAGQTDDAERTRALASAARFLACSLAVVEKAEQDQSAAFGGVATIVSTAHDTFDDALLETAALEPEWSNTSCDLGKFYKLAQMLKDKAKTMGESYAGAMDGDLNKEIARKDSFRGMLQESVVDYAQILLALNELADKMKTDWKVRVDTKSKLPEIPVAWDTASRVASLAVTQPSEATPTAPITKPAINQNALRQAFSAAKVDYNPKGNILTLVYDFKRNEQLKDWDIGGKAPEKDRNMVGIRLAAADSLEHRALFEEGSCTLEYGLSQASDRGPVIDAGTFAKVAQFEWNRKRYFSLNGSGNGERFHPDDSFAMAGDASGLKFQLCLSLEPQRIRLNVNGAETAVNRPGPQPFRFVLHGGKNGGQVASVKIAGRPDVDWLSEEFQ